MIPDRDEDSVPAAPARTSTWIRPDGAAVELAEWHCPDCDGWHVTALGGIRIGHPCGRTAPQEEAAP